MCAKLLLIVDCVQRMKSVCKAFVIVENEECVQSFFIVEIEEYMQSCYCRE